MSALRAACARHPDRLSVRDDVDACAICWRSLQKQARGLTDQTPVGALSADDITAAVISRAIRPAAAVELRRKGR